MHMIPEVFTTEANSKLAFALSERGISIATFPSPYHLVRFTMSYRR
jgi:hypothetical protein